MATETKSSAAALWDQITDRRCGVGTPLTSREYEAWNMAETNADDTSVERDFALFSQDWFETFARSYESALDTLPQEV